MERAHLDFLGPLPKSSRRNEYIWVMVNQFTIWIECVPFPSQTAEVTAHAAVCEFFARFGYPFYIHTDQGRNFETCLELFVTCWEFTKRGLRPTDHRTMVRWNAITEP